MPPSPTDRVLALKDYEDFLAGLDANAFTAVVIGGCAVGAYAHLLGGEELSGDLDLLVDSPTLYAITQWVKSRGYPIRKMPQARTIPVAFFQWDGKEVNLLTSSAALMPGEVLPTARILHFGDVQVRIADPYHLLKDKLTVKRPKDLPHIEVLKRFIEEEIVQTFRDEPDRHKRLLPAKRYLDVTKARFLPEGLVDRLIPLARLPSDYRFLINSAPADRQLDDVLAGTDGDAEMQRLRDLRAKARRPRSR